MSARTSRSTYSCAGPYCTVSDTCDASGVCAGTSRDCDDGVSCNGTESCDDTTDRCVAGTSACGAGQVCDAATDSCQLSCGGGATQCGATCVDTTNDPAHCGDCDTACSGVSSTAVCVRSACAYLCDAGYTDCSAATPGCETDLATDEANCGACGNTCSADETCEAGVCTPPHFRTSPSPVDIPGSTGCTLIDDFAGDQVDALDDGTVAVLMRCGTELKLSVSTDFGQTFSTPRPVVSNSSLGAATVLARSADDIFVSFGVRASRTGYVTRTRTQGVTWGTTGSAPSFIPGGDSPYYGALSLASGGRHLYVSYGNPAVARLFQSTDGGIWTELDSVSGPNYTPDLGVDRIGNLLFATDLGSIARMLRYDAVAGRWSGAGTLPHNTQADFAFGGSWSYGGGSTPTLKRVSTTPGDSLSVVSQSLSGAPTSTHHSIDADADGNLYCARWRSSTSIRLFRWQDGADAIDSTPIDVTVPDGESIMALTAPPSGGAVVMAIYSAATEPIRIHVQAY